MQYLLYLLFFVLCFLPSAVGASDILLDPGHSPAKPGAMSCSGVYEYEYNEAVLRTILWYLQSRNIRVDVTRNPGEDVSLEQRAAQAKGKKLFLSLHHDSAQAKYITTVNGHPCSDKVRGHSIFVSKKNKHFAKSMRYARFLGELLYACRMRPSTHHGEAIKGENRPVLDARLGIYQYDDLIVLKQADAPALLLEIAVIINPEDDAFAKRQDFQQLIAQVVEELIGYVQKASQEKSEPEKSGTKKSGTKKSSTTK